MYVVMCFWDYIILYYIYVERRFKILVLILIFCTAVNLIVINYFSLLYGIRGNLMSEINTKEV